MTKIHIACLVAMTALLSCKTDTAVQDSAGGDILIADFEGRSYGGWKATGTAFGKKPARANIAPRNKVTGHRGRGLVNSHLGGDGATGALTSPEFTIRRDYINLLVGGGNHGGETCSNLLVDGRMVRTATGWAKKNAKGQETLDWRSWRVKGLKGRTVTLQILDTHTGGWGHINVDQIFQSDTPRRAAKKAPAKMPVAKKKRPRSNVSKVPKFTFATTLEEQKEQLRTNPLMARFRKSRKQQLNDPHFPAYHYVSPENRLNDPNGLCFWKGKWHLFYQGYPPEDPRQHWGHAISDDLIHWKDLPYAIYPDPERACYSGSALV